MINHLLPAFILSVAVVEDLRTQKVRNKVILSLAVVALVGQVALKGWLGVIDGLLGMTVGILISLPLVLAKGLGAGDMKVLAVLGLATHWKLALWTALFSLVWGALLGVFKAILDKQGLNLIRNTVFLLSRSKPVSPTAYHRIPYTIALLFGWATYVTLAMRGAV